jgi:hypothetical protein
MELDREAENLWTTGEMGAVLQHQLAAPAERELRSVDPGLACEFTQYTRMHDEGIESFGDLFRHPSPPLELLKLTKAFAKASRRDRNNALPKELCGLLYFLCIALAMIRCEERITSLPDAQIKKGLQWAIGREWIKPDMQEILREARRHF